MDKQIINATQGGAKIKGTKQMLLQDVIKKYCTEKIDKSKIEPLLTLAHDGDELIEKVIPLLKQDIDNLTEIIKQSKRGLAANQGLKTLLKRKSYRYILTKKKEKNFEKIIIAASKESGGNIITSNILFFKRVIKGLRKCKLKNIITLSYNNFVASENAHVASEKNPLVKVAIYGAARQIQGRDLKVEENIINFLRKPVDALIRIERNTLILKAAKNAAISLSESYNKTYKLLKEYNRTKDESLLVNQEIEEINLDDAETYFEAGNWAHTLLDAEVILDDPNCGPGFKLYRDAQKVYNKALALKHGAIEFAITQEEKNSDHERKLLEYNDILEEAKRTGKEDQKFPEALEMIKKAIELMPDETEARWGLATAYHHSGEIENSLKEYRKLIKDFPDIHTFAFEYGQVLLTHEKEQEGLKVISEVMQKTEEYDNFFSHIGDIYTHLELWEEALSAYESYLVKFPFDYVVWKKKGHVYSTCGGKREAVSCYKKVQKIKPDYKKGEIKRLLIQMGNKI